MKLNHDPQDVLSFWFEELEPKDWFVSRDEVDNTIIHRFKNLLESAAKSELYAWRETAEGRLAEVIVLDQFSRNVYRDSPQAFAQDSLALALAQEAIKLELDKRLPIEQRAFFYLPFMHSESKIIHEEAITLFRQPGLENNYDFEIKHKNIIDKFGRYPHRNSVLGRESTSEEIEFLTQPNSSF